jgi:TolA-binding protein
LYFEFINSGEGIIMGWTGTLGGRVMRVMKDLRRDLLIQDGTRTNNESTENLYMAFRDVLHFLIYYDQQQPGKGPPPPSWDEFSNWCGAYLLQEQPDPMLADEVWKIHWHFTDQDFQSHWNKQRQGKDNEPKEEWGVLNLGLEMLLSEARMRLQVQKGQLQMQEDKLQMQEDKLQMQEKQLQRQEEQMRRQEEEMQILRRQESIKHELKKQLEAALTTQQRLRKEAREQKDKNDNLNALLKASQNLVKSKTDMVKRKRTIGDDKLKRITNKNLTDAMSRVVENMIDMGTDGNHSSQEGDDTREGDDTSEGLFYDAYDLR